MAYDSSAIGAPVCAYGSAITGQCRTSFRTDQYALYTTPLPRNPLFVIEDPYSIANDYYKTDGSDIGVGLDGFNQAVDLETYYSPGTLGAPQQAYGGQPPYGLLQFTDKPGYGGLAGANLPN